MIAHFISTLLGLSIAYGLSSDVSFRKALSKVNNFNRGVIGCAAIDPTPQLAPTKQFLNTKELPSAIQMAIQSVVRICGCGRGCASACAIGKPGHFITNLHAWQPADGSQQGKNCEKAYVKTADGKIIGPIEARIAKEGYWDGKTESVDNNHSEDLMAIDLPGAASIRPLPVASRAADSAKDALFFGGFPEGTFDHIDPSINNGFYISQGHITANSTKNITADFIGMNGMSGSCVLNERGEVAGVFWGHERDSVWEQRTLWQVNKPMPPIPSLSIPEQSYFIPLQFVRQFAE